MNGKLKSVVSISREKVVKEVPNLTQENINQLRQLFPNTVSEGKVNFGKLKEILGEVNGGEPERFTFSWAGKRNAIHILQMPTRATLIPVKEESINFDTTQNIFIEGDNLEVLKLLCKSYFGKIKMIYIDPPFNTGKDFVYPDNYSDPLQSYLRITQQKDESGNYLTSNPETSGRYHSTWLSMIYPRLFLARQFLSEDGIIFVSIDDNEMHNLREMMNEIFGEENALDRGIIIWVNKGSTKGFNRIVKNHEYILAYAKNIENVKSLFGDNFPSELGFVEHYCYNAPNPGNPPCEIIFKRGCKIIGIKDKVFKNFVGDEVRLEIISGEMIFKNGVLVKDVILRGSFPYRDQIEEFFKNQELGLPTFDYKGQKWEEIFFNSNGLPRYKKSRNTLIISSVLDLPEIPNYGSDDIKELFGKKEIFPFPKPKELILYLCKYFIKSGDVILDFFAGSGTTAHAVMMLNTLLENEGKVKYILVQLPELTDKNSDAYKAGYKTIADIAKERIRKVIKKLEKETKGKLIKNRTFDLGFKVFKLSESNYKSWSGIPDRTPKKYAIEMKNHLDSLVNGWKNENVIYEILLKEGFQLTSNIEQDKKQNGNEIWRVTDNSNKSIIICLDDKIKSSTIKNLELEKDLIFICRDIALDDTLAANIALQCHLKTI